jgi:hypothetical protein
MNERWIHRHDKHPFFRLLWSASYPSVGSKQMLGKKLRQPRFILFGLPTSFHDQHAIEIIAGQGPQHVSRFLKRPARPQHSLFVQSGNQPRLVLPPSRLDLLCHLRQLGGHGPGNPQQFQLADQGLVGLAGPWSRAIP